MKYYLLLCALVCLNALWGQSFQYPVPPDSILGRQERIDYMLSNFWDDKTIGDTALFKSPSLLMDYLYLLGQSGESASMRYTKSFISKACKKDSFDQILFWLDNILYDSSSPHYNESLYTKLLNVVMQCDVDTVMKLLPAQRLEMMSKNQICSMANNFTFVDKTGIYRELYDIDASLLLIVFNNPDCSICHHTEEYIAGNKEFLSMIDKGKLTVLAITPDAEYDDWLNFRCYLAC